MSWSDQISDYVAHVAGVRGSILNTYLEIWVLRVDDGLDLYRAVHGYIPMTDKLLALSARFCIHHQPNPMYSREHIWLTFDDVKIGGIHLNHLPPWDVKEDEI